MNRKQLEDAISARSYAIWEREGREAGREQEYWERARAEIAEEVRAALDGETGYVPPLINVTQRPIRRAA